VDPETDLELARLQWRLVVQGRHAWTALSVAVLAAMGLALQSRTPAGAASPLGTVFALAALTCCAIWLLAQRSSRVLEAQIKTAIRAQGEISLNAPRSEPRALKPVARSL
jgi:hypothetical protein